MGKIISLDKLQALSVQLRTIFATKTEVAEKVDKVEGKGLSDNNFTDRDKSVCEYANPLLGEGVLALNLVGPDGKIYQLALNSEFDLVLGASIENRQINYFMSGTDYYCIEEQSDGSMSLVKKTSIPEGSVVGVLRIANGMNKYNVNVVNGEITFVETTEVIDNEAKYLICSNNPEKLCHFIMEDGLVVCKVTLNNSTVEVNVK
jgi:hypothetical protein